MQIYREQEFALRALGWSYAEAPWTPNWNFEGSSDSDVAAVSRLTERTLREVFGLTDADVSLVGIQRRFLKGEQA